MGEAAAQLPVFSRARPILATFVGDDAAPDLIGPILRYSGMPAGVIPANPQNALASPVLESLRGGATD